MAAIIAMGQIIHGPSGGARSLLGLPYAAGKPAPQSKPAAQALQRTGELRLHQDTIVRITRNWVERFVVELNLCPFARRALDAGGVRFAVSHAEDEAALLEALALELAILRDDPAIETAFLIHPQVLQDFFDYNQFLDAAESLLRGLGLEGELQIASFHPQYQFADTGAEDAENYSNRSPFPMLHLLREASIERAVAEHPDIDSVPAGNIARLNALGAEALRARWRACLDD
jgi:hypothetical protein